MRILIVEDEASSRHMLKSYLSPYGSCDTAADGQEAIDQVEKGLNSPEGNYDLICLDIKLPVMNGMEVLKNIRRIEEEKGIQPGDGAKVIMTTALNDRHKVLEAFREQCEVYLVKPIEKKKLIEHMEKLGLI